MMMKKGNMMGSEKSEKAMLGRGESGAGAGDSSPGMAMRERGTDIQGAVRMGTMSMGMNGECANNIYQSPNRPELAKGR